MNNKFKAFDKVLVRNYDEEKWFATFYSSFNPNTQHHLCTDGKYYKFCIPFNKYKHLNNRCGEAVISDKKILSVNKTKLKKRYIINRKHIEVSGYGYRYVHPFTENIFLECFYSLKNDVIQRRNIIETNPQELFNDIKNDNGLMNDIHDIFIYHIGNEILCSVGKYLKYNSKI